MLYQIHVDIFDNFILTLKLSWERYNSINIKSNVIFDHDLPTKRYLEILPQFLFLPSYYLIVNGVQINTTAKNNKF